MKNIFCLLLLVIPCQMFAQAPLIGGNRVDYYSSWTERTAKVVPYGEIHLSALAVSRYGNYPKTEINSQLLLFPFAPNIGVKHEWFGESTIVSTQHTFYYPTLGLNWAKNSGFQDQIPESSEVPHIFTFRNELIVSHIINPQPKDCFIKVPDLVLTGRLGFDFSLVAGDSQLPLLDYHFLYHRTASYHNSQKLYFMGVELDGNAYNNFNFSINADYYSIDFNGEWAAESQGKIHWHRDSKFSVSGGYKMYYLSSNYGTQLLAMPVIDFVFKLNHRTRLQNGLFKK
ncbi:MAG: hypothetical protein ACERIH_08190 [Labilibaculum antarcticum]